MSDASFNKDPQSRHGSGGTLRPDARVSPRTVLETAGPSVRSTRKSWRVAFVTFVAVAIIFFSAQFIGQLVISVYPVIHHWSDAETSRWIMNSVGAQFAYGLLADGLMVGGIALMLQILHWKWATIGLRRPNLWHIGLGLVAFVPYIIAYIAVVVTVSWLVPSLNLQQKQEIGFDSVHGTLPLFLTFISLVVVPPLAEEITMRGFLYTGFRRWMPKIVAAVMVSGLFGVAHLAEGGDGAPLWIGAIDTFTLSMVLVFLREQTGNLWAGITLHALKNGVAFVMLFIIGGR